MMKKLLKCALVLALAVLVLSAAAFAAGSSITYRGGGSFDLAPGSDYTDTDLFENFKDVLPGDVLTETITFTNKATDCDYVKLYIRAVAHDEESNPLSEKVAEDETVASMSDFLSQLSMKVYNGSELIYEASPDELDGLKDNVLLGEFRKNDATTLTVELTVPIELGNKYAYRVGEVDWVFHVDALNDPAQNVSKTGDDAMPIVYLALALTATAAVIMIARKKRAE